VAESGGFVVRPATEEDLPAALELFAALDSHQHGWRVFEPRPTAADDAEARYRTALGLDPDALHVVADEGGRLLGMAFARIEALSSISDERSAELSNVIVREEARRRGIGEALVTEVGRWASGRGVRRVVIKTYAANDLAMQFWEALGFRPRYVQLTAVAEELGARPHI